MTPPLTDGTLIIAMALGFVAGIIVGVIFSVDHRRGRRE
jgi:hypothetical protein